MTEIPLPKLIGLAALIAGSAFFSSAETCLSTSSRIRLQAKADAGSKPAKTVIKILDRYSKAVSAILIGNNIVNIAASSLATVLAIDVGFSVSAAAGILTIILLLFGEILPKNLAKLKSEPLACAYAPIVDLIMLLLTPVIAVTSGLEKLFMIILRIDPNAKQPMTEAELRAYVEMSHADEVIADNEKEIIENVMDFGDMAAQEIMIPRVDMAMLPITASYQDVRAAYKESMFTRTPIYDGTQDNIVGTLNIKDFVLAEPEGFDVRSIMQQPSFVHENKKLKDILALMRKENISIIYVIDEYGGAAGMLTLEDLLSEIVGDLRDEYDAMDEKICKVSDTSYKIEGSTNLNEIEDATGVVLDAGDYNSIGGYVIYETDGIPEQGAVIEKHGVRCTVEAVSQNRVESVLLEILPGQMPETA